MDRQYDERQLVLDAARLMAQGQDAEALAALQRCLAQHPGSAGAHHLLGAQFAQLGRYDEARQHLVLALHYAPQMHEARLQLALLLLTLDQPQSALEALQAAVAAELPPAVGAYLGALVAIAQGRLEAAAVLLDKGLAIGHTNVALDGDMRRLREQVRGGLEGGGDGIGAGDVEPGTDHVLLQAYGTRCG